MGFNYARENRKFLIECGKFEEFALKQGMSKEGISEIYDLDRTRFNRREAFEKRTTLVDMDILNSYSLHADQYSADSEFEKCLGLFEVASEELMSAFSQINLTHYQKQILYLHYECELTLKEVAVALNRTYRGVLTAHGELIRRLRGVLEQS